MDLGTLLPVNMDLGNHLFPVTLDSLKTSISTDLLLAGAVAGFVIHQVLRRTFIDLYPFSILGTVVASHWALLGAFYRYGEYNFWDANRQALAVVGYTLASLAVNIAVYRAFFHRLRHFPGPFGAKVSKFWAVWQTLKSKARWYQVTQRLHEEYGDYVRTGKEKPPARTRKAQGN